MGKVKTKFNGQLSGQKAKESYLAEVISKNNLKVPKVGEKATYELKADKLTGALLSILDGKNSLKVNGQPVSKIAVYEGKVALPSFSKFAFTIERVSDLASKLSATIGK